jgi:hypothetical protein
MRVPAISGPRPRLIIVASAVVSTMSEFSGISEPIHAIHYGFPAASQLDSPAIFGVGNDSGQLVPGRGNGISPGHGLSLHMTTHI